MSVPCMGKDSQDDLGDFETALAQSDLGSAYFFRGDHKESYHIPSSVLCLETSCR
jgi:hypothetical protein